MKEKIHAILIPAICLLGTSACSVVHKAYKAPRVEHAEQLYGPYGTADSVTAAFVPWRAYFTDTLLVRLIDEGIVGNPDLRIAETRIRVAEAGLREARRAFFPDIALTGEVEHLRTSDGSRGKDVLGYRSTEYTLGITAGWELDVWGKLNSRRKSEYAAFLGSRAYRNLVQTSLVANIATAYYSLLALDEELRVTRSVIGLMEENLSVMIKLKESGLQNGAAVEQSKVTLYETRSRVPELEYRIEEMEHALCVLLGRIPGGIERGTFDAHAARSAFYPSVRLTSGTLGYNNLNTLSEFLRPENMLLNLVGGLTQPLFSRGRLRSELEIAKAREDEALLSFRKTVLAAGQEVTDILAEFRSSVQKNDTRRHQVEAARNSVDYTRKLLLAGEVDYTEVLTAEESLLSSRLAQVDDRLRQILCAVRMYRALGGGIE